MTASAGAAPELAQHEPGTVLVGNLRTTAQAVPGVPAWGRRREGREKVRQGRRGTGGGRTGGAELHRIHGPTQSVFPLHQLNSQRRI